MADAATENDTQAIAALLQDDGYRAKVELADETIRSATAGYNISLYCPNKALLLRCSVIGKDFGVRLEQVNAFNGSFRFAKLYLDEDGDVVLESDHLFDVRKDKAGETLRRIMRLFESLINEMAKVLYAAEKQAEGEPRPQGEEPTSAPLDD